ncbi:hypothetical protein FRC02_006652 [Tulasnella sp. 418]|nr:hypothetical protein FRC02_006652 [Tulasnella sp. 418]
METSGSSSQVQSPSTPPKHSPATEESGLASGTGGPSRESFHSTPISAFNQHYSTTRYNQKFQTPKLTRMSIFQRHSSFFSRLFPGLPKQSDFSTACLESLQGGF